MNLQQKNIDLSSQQSLNQILQPQEILKNRFEKIRFVLVVLSSKGIVFDLNAMRYRILQSYPDATIFFQTASGKPLGPSAPYVLDLVIDLVGPKQRQSFWEAYRLRRRTRFAVGRKTGFFRCLKYDRLYDELAFDQQLPQEVLQREREVQREVLKLAGVFFVMTSEALEDRSDCIALELPKMQRRSP